MKLMTISLAIMSVCHIASAQEVIVATNKKMALKACQEQAQASPSALREEMLKSCQCVIEHTDFSQAEKLRKLGDAEGLQALYQQASEACLEQ